MKSLVTMLTAVLLLSVSSGAFAADKKPTTEKSPAKMGAKADPSGTWTWTMTRPDGQTMERTVKLTREGDKLTGTSTGRNGENPIEQGTFKNGDVSFSIVRERDGRKIVSKFTGKMEGDLIKGTTTSNFGGEDRTMPWEAKRAK